MKFVVQLYQAYQDLQRIFKIEKEANLGKLDSVRLINTRIANRLLNNNINVDAVKVLGHTMYLDQNDCLNLSWNKIYEAYETKIMKSLIKPGDVVVDLGAFIGYYTLIFAEIVGQSGQVVAFEPRPSNAQILRKNIQVNNYSNVLVEEKAVSDVEGKITLYLCTDNHGMNRLYKSAYCDESVEVECITLDSYFKNSNKKIDFIKMDVEGSEYGVLEGMTRILEKNNNIKILLEFNPSSIIEYGKTPEELIGLLNSYGFNIYRLNRRTKAKDIIQPKSMSNLVKDVMAEAATGITTNLLCTRS
jgi:FkbM family methyltransferase